MKHLILCKKWMTVLLIAAITALMTSCAEADVNPAPTSSTNVQPVSESYFIFDTFVTVRIYDDRVTEQHFAEIHEIMLKIDNQMNRNNEDSEISHVNNRSGDGPVVVSQQTFDVVQRAIDIAALSGGRFDPTIGALVDLWGIGQEGAHRPDYELIQDAAERVDYRNVRLDKVNLTIELLKPGMDLDLGGSAKGYAGDLIAEYLISHNFNSAIIDLGGNILAVGVKPNGQLWNIGIQNPEDQRGAHLGALKVNNQTIVTSGIYERFFVEDGVHYHHIFNPHDGMPIQNDLLSTTIVTDNSERADLLSTTLFTMGLEEGMSFIESLPDTEAIIINKDREVYISSGLIGRFDVTNPEYTLILE